MTQITNPVESISFNTTTGQSSPAAETVILTTDVDAAGIPAATGRFVRVIADLNITPGTSATAIVVKCRQGATVGSPQIDISYTIGCTAGVNIQAHLLFRDGTDYLKQIGGGQYSITVTETAATVAGTVNALFVEVAQ